MPIRSSLLLALALALLGSSARAEEEEGEASSARPGADADFDALTAETPGPRGEARPVPPREARVRLPLSELHSIWDRLRGELGAGRQGPALILGEGSYRGRIVRKVLQLEITLRAALARPGRWKLVPLVGSGAALRRVTVDGRPVATAIRRGYHVWPTDRSGPVTVQVEALVPPSGPRGAVEYDLVIARTPVTRFECSFPGTGLEPRLDGAVAPALRSSGGATVLSAVLAPTTKLRMVGFRDLGEATAEPARVFAEVLGLLSVDDKTLELFSVIRYNILYASVRELSVVVPRGMTVVSAEGKGAFRYTLSPHPEGTLLRGETATPIRNAFEISLRLRRDRSARETSLEAPLPRCQGVERELGWLAVEAPGRLRLEERDRTQLQAIDLRQLPGELVKSAVSPILRAYRYHDPRRRLRLSADRLPEQETAAEAVDRVRAFSVVSAEGGVLTELRLTLRNRLQRSLSLQPPPGARLLSALIDGQPVQPSQDRSGALVVGLSRSLGEERPSPITVQLILEEPGSPWRLLGRPSLALPRISLPASSLQWSVYLPASNLYSALSGAQEALHGHAPWRRPVEGAPASARARLPVEVEPELGADGGAMPVRIKLPKVGVRLEHTRYWIGEGQEVRVRVSYLRRALQVPALLGVAALLAAGVLLLGARRTDSRVWLRRAAGIALLGATPWPLFKLGGGLALLGAGLSGLLGLGLRRGWPGRARETLRRWAATLPERFRERERPAPASRRQRILRALLGGAMLLALVALLVSLYAVALLLRRPLLG